MLPDGMGGMAGNDGVLRTEEVRLTLTLSLTLSLTPTLTPTPT